MRRPLHRLIFSREASRARAYRRRWRMSPSATGDPATKEGPSNPGNVRGELSITASSRATATGLEVGPPADEAPIPKVTRALLSEARLATTQGRPVARVGDEIMSPTELTDAGRESAINDSAAR